MWNKNVLPSLPLLRTAAAFLLLLAFVRPVDAAQTPLSDSEARELIEEIEQGAAWAEDSLQKLKSDHLDREVLLDSLGYDPEAIILWVTENTLWVPYAGTLRGADGVLMDRRGNSLDRSQLLSALLEDAGVETRLVRAELPAETALRILAEQVSDPVRSIGPKLEASESLRALYAELDAGSRALAALAGLGEAQNSAYPSDSLGGIQDHWWVQAKEGANWVDLDALIPEGSPHLRPTAQQTFASADKLPAELYHSMKLNVVIERLQDGELAEEVALSYVLTPRDALRGHVLEIDLYPFAESWQADDALSGAAALEVADEAELWLPILRVDHKKVEYGQWISKEGTLEKNPMRWAADVKMQQATNALAALGGDKQERPVSHLTAVWLEYQVNRPGDAPRIVRRELSDILGVDRRDADALSAWVLDEQKRRSRGYAMQTNSVALVSIAMPQRPALEHAIYRHYTDNRSFQIALVYKAAGWKDERIEPSLGSAKPYPIDLLGMMTARGLWSRHRDRLFQDEINIWSNHLLWQDDASSDGGIMATDVVLNHVGVVTSTTSQASLMRIEEGMLDTFIEQHLSVDSVGSNAYSRFVKRDPARNDWRLMMNPPGKRMPGDLPRTEQARLVEATEGGARVVVSDEISQIGDQRYAHWWQIDPGDGTTLGMGYRGWGVELTERGGIQVPAKVFDAAQKRGIVTRACKIGQAIVKVSTGVVLMQNPVMIDIAYVVELEAASLYVTQTSSGISRICG